MNSIVKIKFSNYRNIIKAIYSDFDSFSKNFFNLAYKEGCSTCCNKVTIVAYPVESANIARKLNKINKLETLNAIKKKIEDIDKTYKPPATASGDLLAQIDKMNLITDSCPFLIKSKCSIYTSRPLICRMYISNSLEECEKAPTIMGSPEYIKFCADTRQKILELNGDFLNMFPKSNLLPSVIDLGPIYRCIIISEDYTALFLMANTVYIMR